MATKCQVYEDETFFMLTILPDLCTYERLVCFYGYMRLCERSLVLLSVKQRQGLRTESIYSQDPLLQKVL
jgi:hypothetical protein